jgi:hypothetical protein
MKQLVFYALFWLLTGSLYLRNTAEAALQQTNAVTQIEKAVTENASDDGLKDIDIANPLFIYR